VRERLGAAAMLLDTARFPDELKISLGDRSGASWRYRLPRSPI
jgi:hypothetical protein